MRIALVGLSLGLGVVLLLCQLVLVFLPGFPILHFVLFFLVGYIVVRTVRDMAGFVIVVALFLPLAATAFFVWSVHPVLSKGIGIYHLVDLVLIPSAAACGAALARRRSRLRFPRKD